MTSEAIWRLSRPLRPPIRLLKATCMDTRVIKAADFKSEVI